MILIAGGTGGLGEHLVPLLSGEAIPFRLLVRDTEKAAALNAGSVKTSVGDVRSADDLARALRGVDTVVSAISAFGRGAGSLKTVDWEGNRNLIRAAGAAGVEHFVLLSVQGAARDHPIELFRMKYLAEQVLLASRLSWTIIRPTPNIETWVKLVGEPLLESGKTVVFGRGENPINFVSARDVARFVNLAVADFALRGRMIEVGGPQDLTFNRFVQIFESQTGVSGGVSHVPRLALRLSAGLLHPFKPTLAGQIRTAYLMDTIDMRFDQTETTRLYPDLIPTSMEEVLAQDYPRICGPLGVAL